MGTMLGRSSRTTSPALTLTLDTYLSLVWPPTSNRAFLSAHGSLLGVSWMGGASCLRLPRDQSPTPRASAAGGADPRRRPGGRCLHLCF